jgi:plasmid stabilization system protein ParE
MTLAFHELAEQELNDAARCYEREQVGLGTAFIADIGRCTEAILAYPEAGPVIRGHVRRRLCRHFPYAVLYAVRSDAVGDVLGYLAGGMTDNEILQAFPQLERDDIRACLAFAAERQRITIGFPAA